MDDSQIMNTRILITAVVSCFILHSSSFVHAGTTIDPFNQYAYAANLGWLDWSGGSGETANGAVIGAYVCAGYIYSANTGWINLGINHDTAAFAVESIRRWWQQLGQARYHQAKRLLITADCGGSNGARVRLWKTELQALADQTGLSITVAHLPPGTSKWNRIEHRLFAFITQNWRGKPLLTHQVIVQLIASTTTQTGLTVQCRLDQNAYDKGIKISDAEMASLNITPANFHGEWNYTIAPRKPDD